MALKGRQGTAVHYSWPLRLEECPMLFQKYRQQRREEHIKLARLIGMDYNGRLWNVPWVALGLGSLQGEVGPCVNSTPLRTWLQTRPCFK